jgi:hypothetical protein
LELRRRPCWHDGSPEIAFLGGDVDFGIVDREDVGPLGLEWLEDGHQREERITDELENMVDFITQEATAEIIGGAESSVSCTRNSCGLEACEGRDVASVSYMPGEEWHATKQAFATSLCAKQVLYCCSPLFSKDCLETCRQSLENFFGGSIRIVDVVLSSKA